MTCHSCSVQMKRHGFFNGIQRYRCKHCGKTHSEIHNRPLDVMRIPMEKAVQALHLLVEGVGIRACERLTGLNRHTILDLLELAGDRCRRLLDEKIRNIQAEHVEVDELYAYVGMRPEHAPLNDPEFGEFYTYLSTDRKTKLVINHLVGKRNGDNCHVLMGDLKERLANRITLSTDGYAGYIGHTGAVFQAFRREIDYGTEVKMFGREGTGPRRYRPMKCLWAKRTARIGAPDLSEINTSRVERMNLTLRLFTRRFTRSSLGYSKLLRYHKHAVNLFIAHYNFCRTHSALKLPATEILRRQEQTPAMAATLTSHVWTIEELLTVTNQD